MTTNDVHLCDYASQPDIRIACTGAWTTPAWGRKIDDVDTGVYLSDDGFQYAFEEEHVTCKLCLAKQAPVDTMGEDKPMGGSADPKVAATLREALPLVEWRRNPSPELASHGARFFIGKSPGWGFLVGDFEITSQGFPPGARGYDGTASNGGTMVHLSRGLAKEAFDLALAYVEKIERGTKPEGGA